MQCWGSGKVLTCGKGDLGQQGTGVFGKSTKVWVCTGGY